MKVEDFSIGDLVSYCAPHKDAKDEHGVVTGRGAYYVYVRYGNDEHSKATDPMDLRKES